MKMAALVGWKVWFSTSQTYHIALVSLNMGNSQLKFKFVSMNAANIYFFLFAYGMPL